DIASRRLLMASGPGGGVSAYDPAKPAHWPQNPFPLTRLEVAQGTPLGFIHDGRFAWLITQAGEGELSGALARIDPRDGTAQVWRDLVLGRTPTSMVADPAHHQLFVSLK